METGAVGCFLLQTTHAPACTCLSMGLGPDWPRTTYCVKEQAPMPVTSLEHPGTQSPTDRLPEHMSEHLPDIPNPNPFS